MRTWDSTATHVYPWRLLFGETEYSYGVFFLHYSPISEAWGGPCATREHSYRIEHMASWYVGVLPCWRVAWLVVLNDCFLLVDSWLIEWSVDLLVA